MVNLIMIDVNLNILKLFMFYKIKVFGIMNLWEGNIIDIIGL